ncbi:regulatory iron-sulfur-containing complex subunit RicT [Bacteriovoracaceae bacterium]|nr:regulatory iron-sulfur-containing complex subunit RicT [Bacteriovoracaceae bacterium]
MNEEIISEDNNNEIEVKETTAVAKDIKEKKSSRFKDGQDLSLVRVRFPGHAKSLPFLYGRLPIQYGQKVVAMSERGMAVGYINSFPYKTIYKESDHKDLKFIKKIASDEDISQEIEAYKQEKKFETTCADLIEKHELKMQLTHVEFTQFGKKVVFYFYAPARVDFRGLVKDLVTELKLRIELRQISIRDRAASIGSLGPCGRELCCSSFLSRYGHTHIRMAKNQNLSFSGGKINGVCSQPKCCLGYEEEVYAEKRTLLPKEDHIIKTFDGEIGKVTRLHLIIDQFEMLTTKGSIKKYSASMYDTEMNDYNFPQKFDHIEFDNRTVIGLDEDEEDKKEEREQNLSNWEKQGKTEALSIYNKLFEEYEFFNLYKKDEDKPLDAKTNESESSQTEEVKTTELTQEESSEKKDVKVYYSKEEDNTKSDEDAPLNQEQREASKSTEESSNTNGRKHNHRRRNGQNRNKRHHSNNNRSGGNRNSHHKNNKQS